MPMGGKKYNLQIRGNVYSKQQDLRTQFTQEVQGVCKGDYEILDLSRFSAAPRARLSHLSFESDRAFPAQC